MGRLKSSDNDDQNVISDRLYYAIFGWSALRGAIGYLKGAYPAYLQVLQSQNEIEIHSFMIKNILLLSISSVTCGYLAAEASVMITNYLFEHDKYQVKIISVDSSNSD